MHMHAYNTRKFTNLKTSVPESIPKFVICFDLGSRMYDSARFASFFDASTHIFLLQKWLRPSSTHILDIPASHFGACVLV